MKGSKGSKVYVEIPLPFVKRSLLVSAEGMFLVILALGVAAWLGVHGDMIAAAVKLLR